MFVIGMIIIHHSVTVNRCNMHMQYIHRQIIAVTIIQLKGQFITLFKDKSALSYLFALMTDK